MQATGDMASASRSASHGKGKNGKEVITRKGRQDRKE